jgi:hypothetical protein
LSESVISAGWNLNKRPLELNHDDSLHDDEFELTLDSDSEEWDEECLDNAPEGDLWANEYQPSLTSGKADSWQAAPGRLPPFLT